MKQLPTQERLRALFSYQDGALIRLCLVQGSKYRIGQRAGAKCGRYRMISVDGVQFQESWIIWAWHGRQIPEGKVLDHVNNVSDDNRIENLQVLDHRANVSKDSRGPLPLGVSKPKNRYVARILVKGKRIYLGSFGTIEEAAKAYSDALLYYTGVHS